jgi:two-component system cell cycle response regulator DivK
VVAFTGGFESGKRVGYHFWMRVLLVEDIDDNRDLFRIMLERFGHEVIEATNGKEGVQAAVHSNPDLVLMDLSMPETDGIEATAALRAISSFSRVPIIAITAHSQWKERAFTAGCDAYLVKPITPEDLGATLARFSIAS